MAANIRQIDIARKVGVSQRTVSAVLGSTTANGVRVSPDTARQIREVADRLGYTPYSPAQLMRGKGSGLIGVLIGDSEGSAQQRRLALLDRLLWREGFRLMIGHLHAPRDVDAYVADFLGRGAEGVVCIRHEFPASSSSYVPERLSRLRHVVYLDPPSGITNACFVQPDRRTGIRQAMAHLAGCGRKRIGLITDNPNRAGRRGTPMRERLAGYTEGLADAGLAFDPVLIRGDKRLAEIDLYPHLAGIMVDDLVLQNGADAVLANNDAVGVRLIKALQAKHIRVPEDVAVIGYDNDPVSLVTTPEMTTIDHDHHRVAHELTDMLTTLVINGKLPKGGNQRMVAPKLMVRGSTVPATTSNVDNPAAHDASRAFLSVSKQ